MKTLAIISFVMMAAFIGLSVWRFGLQKSWGSYAKKWTEAVPMHNVNAWSIVTVIAALLLAIPLIGNLAGNQGQAIGLLAPACVVAMAVTPHHESSHSQSLVHGAAFFAFAILVLTLCIFALHLWWLPLVCVAGFFFLPAATTRTIKSSWPLWLFSGLLATLYIVSMIPIGG